MKLLVLGINYAPEIISTAVYTTGLSEAMASYGHEVSVVTAQPYYPGWKVFQDYPKYGYRCEQPSENLSVVHCPHYVPRTPSGARRILHHASFALTAAPRALWLAIKKRPDVVFVVAPSLITAPVGWAVARLTGAKCWLHIQDFEVEAAFATGLLKKGSLLGRMGKSFEKWVIKRFDRVSSISDPMLNKLRNLGVDEGRIFELRNWANLGKISRLEGDSPMRLELGIESKYVALYSGNIANKQGLEILGKVARKLSHRHDLTIAICGDGPFLAELKQRCLGLENVRFFPLQPLEKLSDLLGMATVHLLPQIAGAADLVLPSKLTNMLASGRPVLATADTDTALAHEVENCGLVVQPENANALADALEGLLDDPGKCARLGANARERAFDRWDSVQILGRLESELLGLDGRQKPSNNCNLPI